MWNGLSRCVAAMGCVSAIGLFSGTVHAEDITPESVAGKNIKTAEDFIRATGNVALADNIEAFLTTGRFSSEDLSGEAGETSAFNNIKLDKLTAAPLTAPLDGAKNFDLVLRLAAVLTHEKKHAHQSLRDKINPWWKEYDAWTAEIFALDEWIKFLRDQWRKTATADNLDHLKSAVDLKIETLNEFTGTQKCFGYPCDAFTSLLDTMKLLRDRLATTKPAGAGDTKVGALIQKADETDQTAKGQSPAPGTPPASPPPGVPTPYGATPTHRVSSCPTCRGKADELNAASDKLADATNVDATQRAALVADVKRLSDELDACEAHCVTKVSVAPPPVVVPRHGLFDGRAVGSGAELFAHAGFPGGTLGVLFSVTDRFDLGASAAPVYDALLETGNFASTASFGMDLRAIARYELLRQRHPRAARARRAWREVRVVRPGDHVGRRPRHRARPGHPRLRARDARPRARGPALLRRRPAPVHPGPHPAGSRLRVSAGRRHRHRRARQRGAFDCDPHRGWRGHDRLCAHRRSDRHRPHLEVRSLGGRSRA